ncbi:MULTISPECIES: bifunctional 2-polyprenyl-6-hydroxyphenol methylase/3-demethylubiquinol 3-O-methyltransferase UbiG [unclassified Thioalkalivibrio]|uniref:bifunctional 2-polyprenyl-6-hydroxyphenol methylase/3-demethylubiquinol 3-O-methyltransferase UbiG n=1 Tax=unclassified Thioalkalivibrio TaxID=2621013 RepID=UPI00035C2E76|nr:MULTISPECIES: bifunctional 2-polyprenyl-6-hydroxyphenol methylase/3-demethylubiquinol 3-O-methyltransferase UbiG [unclassified Thioalkalivibrio]
MTSPNVEHDRTVDPAEVERYRALAEMWWEPDGRLWPLHVLNGLRSDYIRDQLCHSLGRDAEAERPLDGLRILDIGCGGGLLSEAMARLGANVLGVDVVDRNIAAARLHAAEQGLDIEYEVNTAEALAARGETFDVILNMEVVEHVADLPAFMASVNRMLRAGGHTFVATINRNPVSFVVAIVGAEYLFRILPRGTHQWKRFVTPRETRALLARDGLEPVAQTGVKVNPLSRRMWLSRSMSVNYMLLARKPEA